MKTRILEGGQSAERAAPTLSGWREVFDESGKARDVYAPVLTRFRHLRSKELKALDEKMEAILREMGIMFSNSKPQSLHASRAWLCDVLPAIFAVDEWTKLVQGTQQRLKAFEAFLADIHGERAILRAGVLPIHVVLGSPYFLKPSFGLKPSGGNYLHLSSLCVTRHTDGQFVVKCHRMSQVQGISYMVQNRRVVARAAPDLFTSVAVAPIAETPTMILERLRRAADGMDLDPTVVMLSSGPESPDYSEYSFLARRMGIPLVQGSDLLVLDDLLYLKTVGGLERVEVVYSRLPEAMLDPLVLRRDSRLGVPGLVHCVRLGTVKLLNSLGSQLADDRSLLPFSAKIIRFYLAENPILPTLPTYLCGDIDQREMVLSNLNQYRILPLCGESVLGNQRGLPPSEKEEAIVRTELRKNSHLYVAQQLQQDTVTLCFQRDQLVHRAQDHLIYALRSGDEFEIVPGCLTRISSENSIFTSPELGGGSKDSWVLTNESGELPNPQEFSRRRPEVRRPIRHVTSRVAESFYWMGRYLERSYHLAYMIQVIETLEAEELNSSERKLYRPVWNRLLPPLGDRVQASKRSIDSPKDRYQLIFNPELQGSLHNTFARAVWNAEGVLESLSPEAWLAITSLRGMFGKTTYRVNLKEADCARATRRVTDAAVRLIRQFFGTATSTMLRDDGWMFCEIGESIERATITANALTSLSSSLTQFITRQAFSHSSEIELSAFLRLLGSRDAYRRVYQMRAEPLGVLEILWQNSEAPRSVLHCLEVCSARLAEALPPTNSGAMRTLAALESLIQRIKRLDWSTYFAAEGSEAKKAGGRMNSLLMELLRQTMEIDTFISDSFLNHQAMLTQPTQPALAGFQAYAI